MRAICVRILDVGRDLGRRRSELSGGLSLGAGRLSADVHCRPLRPRPAGTRCCIAPESTINPQPIRGDLSGGASGPPDAELIRRSIEGDRRAPGELIERYKGLVYSIPRRYRLNDDVCDDVFQSVFLAMVKALPSLRDGQTLAKWLMTTTHRECWRASKRRHLALTEEQSRILRNEPPAGDDMVRWERQHRVQQALEELGGRCEQLLRLAFMDPGKPGYEAISERLGMPVGSIGPIRARCLAKLAELLGDLE